MRLGLIGLKGHQSVVLEGARKLGDVELVAVSDDNANDLQRFKQREPLARKAETYADWRHLLDHTMMDVACVCDTNNVRVEQLVALYERGIHIVTEKPLTTTLADLDRLRKAAAGSKARLTMLLTMRHEAQYGRMRSLIKEGVIGEVCQVSVQKSYRLNQRPEWFKSRAVLGGTIPYIGIHAVDMARWVTGLDYTHVAAFHNCMGKPQMKETESQASLLLRMSNGASATIRLDYLRPEPAPSHGDDRIRVAGSEGVVELRYGERNVMVVTSEKEPYTVPPEPVPNLFVAFVEALRKNAPTPIPAEDCFYVTEVVLTARDAADKMQMLEIGKGRG